MLSGDGAVGPIERYLAERRLVLSSRIVDDGEAMAPDSPFLSISGTVTIWNGLRIDGNIPLRRDLRPERLGRFLPKISILEVNFAENDFEWSLHGGEHEYWMGGSLKGKRASQIPGRAVANLRDQTILLARKSTPGYLEMQYLLDGALFLAAYVISLPFVHAEAHKRVIICPTNFVLNGSRDML